MDKSKEKKFKDFEEGKINLGEDDLLEYASQAYFKPDNSHEITLKKLQSEEARDIIKTLRKLKHTKKSTPESDMLIKDLDKLMVIFSDKIKNETDPEERLRLMNEFAFIGDVYSINKSLPPTFDAYRVQYKRFTYDYHGAFVLAEKLLENFPDDSKVKLLYADLRANANRIKNRDFDLDIDEKTNDEALIKKAEDLFNDPYECLQLLWYYEKQSYSKVVETIIENLYWHSLNEGFRDKDLHNMILSLNMAIFLRPKMGLLYATRGIGKCMLQDFFEAQRDLEEAQRLSDYKYDPNSNLDVNYKNNTNTLVSFIDDLFTSDLDN